MSEEGPSGGARTKEKTREGPVGVRNDEREGRPVGLTVKGPTERGVWYSELSSLSQRVSVMPAHCYLRKNFYINYCTVF